MLKKMGSFLPARSSKERSASEDPTTVDSSDVFLQATGTVGQLFSAELGVPVNELQQLKWEVEQLRRQLASASAPPPATVSKVHDPNEALEADATASVAYAYITRVCRVSEVDAPTFVALLELLRSNPAYRGLALPEDNVELRKYGARMFMLADVDRDGVLNETEFTLVWRHLPTSKAPAVLSARYGVKGVAPSTSFVFGSRDDWCVHRPTLTHGAHPLVLDVQTVARRRFAGRGGVDTLAKGGRRGVHGS